MLSIQRTKTLPDSRLTAPALVWLVAALVSLRTVELATAAPPPARLNFLLITVDDMNCDSVGIYGCEVTGITPNIDRFASQALRFEHAHVTIAVCQPTRTVWLTGRYPHNNGALGFQRISNGVPTLLEQLHDSGPTMGCRSPSPRRTATGTRHGRRGSCAGRARLLPGASIATTSSVA